MLELKILKVLNLVLFIYKLTCFFLLTEFSTLSILNTEDHLTRWERAFEDTYVYKLAVLNNNVLRERMKAVIDKSMYCDTSLLR